MRSYYTKFSCKKQSVRRKQSKQKTGSLFVKVADL